MLLEPHSWDLASGRCSVCGDSITDPSGPLCVGPQPQTPPDREELIRKIAAIFIGQVEPLCQMLRADPVAVVWGMGAAVVSIASSIHDTTTGKNLVDPVMDEMHGHAARLRAAERQAKRMAN